MQPERNWVELIAWLLAASLAILHVELAHAADGSAIAGPSITLNRGETYVVKGVSRDHEPEVTPIDNSHALIVSREPSGNVILLGAEKGSEKVRFTMADGNTQTYTVTVQAISEPDKPLAPGSAPPAMADSGPPVVSVEPAPASPLDWGSGPVDASGTAKVANVSSASPNGASGGSAAASGPGTSATPAADAAAAPLPPAAPSTATEGPMSASASSGSVIPSQGASEAAVQAVSGKVTNDPRPSEYREDEGAPAVGSAHFLPDDAIAMLLGTSRVFDFPGKLKRVSIADTEIADLQVINPHQVMLIGHKPGFTTLAVWDNQGHYEERQVRIEQTGHQQVMLNCVVAEVDRSRLETQGINFSGTMTNSGISLVGLPGTVATPYGPSSNIISSSSSSSGGLLPSGGQLIPLILSGNVTYGLATQNGNILTNSFFQFLETHNLGRVLAEPHLLANSGQEAKFLSGGEIPIVIAQALNTSIVFKEYGTKVTFLPTVVGKRDIELVVKPEVSQPDQSQGVELNGFQVPAFVTRRAETVVRMKDNQTLIMAGLIEDDKKQVVQKVPYLGDLPFAGGLFRNTSYQDVKTEIVMSVTPQIVTALSSGAQIDYPIAGSINPSAIQTERLSEPNASRPRF